MRKLFLILFTLVLLISLVSIVNASTYNVEISQIGGKTLEKHIMHFDSPLSLRFELPPDASSISSNLNYSVQGKELVLYGKDIELSYLTQSSIESAEDGYFFIKTINFYSNFNNSYIELILDKGYYVDKSRVFPHPDLITTDGQQITLAWILSDIKKGEDMPVFVAIMSPAPSMILVLLFWVLVAALLIIAGYWFYLRIKKKPVKIVHKKPKAKSKEAEKFEDIERYLVESEKAVLVELKKADRGELWQKQLQIATGFSKAKLSRVIRNLESRNLVEKIAFGNTNKVRLK